MIITYQKDIYNTTKHNLQAAAAGANNSVTLVPGKAIGPTPLANTAPSNKPTSVPLNCDCYEATLSNNAMSLSSVTSAVVSNVESFLYSDLNDFDDEDDVGLDEEDDSLLPFLLFGGC